MQFSINLFQIVENRANLSVANLSYLVDLISNLIDLNSSLYMLLEITGEKFYAPCCWPYLINWVYLRKQTSGVHNSNYLIHLLATCLPILRAELQSCYTYVHYYCSWLVFYWTKWFNKISKRFLCLWKQGWNAFSPHIHFIGNKSTYIRYLTNNSDNMSQNIT